MDGNTVFGSAVMSSITRIRVGTDFSGHADEAAGRAARLAPALGVDTISLVHAMDSHRVRAVRDLLPVLGELQLKQTQSAEASLNARAEELKQQHGLDWHPELREGTPVSALLDEAGAADLVVVGGGGREGIGAVMLGSTAERVVRSSSAPVLVVRQEPAADYAHVLVPVDFSEDARAALELARDLAPNATLHLVHAYPPLPAAYHVHAPLTEEDIARYKEEVERDSAEQMEALVNECGLNDNRVERVLDYNYPPRMIAEQARAVNADLIAMGRHGHNRAADWLLGSVTTHVLNHLERDVLITHA